MSIRLVNGNYNHINIALNSDSKSNSTFREIDTVCKHLCFFTNTSFYFAVLNISLWVTIPGNSYKYWKGTIGCNKGSHICCKNVIQFKDCCTVRTIWPYRDKIIEWFSGRHIAFQWVKYRAYLSHCSTNCSSPLQFVTICQLYRHTYMCTSWLMHS